MKNLPNFVTGSLKIFLILSIAGLIIKSAFATWAFFSHHLNLEPYILKFYDGVDFTKIFQTDAAIFTVLLFFALLINILQINLFLAALQILKNLNFENPFGQNLIPLFRRISMMALIVGMVSIILKIYTETSVSNDLVLSTQMGESSYLWFSAIVYIATLVYDKGLSIKSENDLTI